MPAAMHRGVEETCELLAEEDRADDMPVELDHPRAVGTEVVGDELGWLGMALAADNGGSRPRGRRPRTPLRRPAGTVAAAAARCATPRANDGASGRLDAVSMREAWDGQAANWTNWVRTPGHDSYEQFHGERFFDLVPAPGRLTIDLGAGEGRVARDLRHAATSWSRSKDRPAWRARSAELGEQCVVNADVARLPIVSGAADLAIAFMSLQDVDEWAAAISEAARVLVPGGRLAMAIVHPINSIGSIHTGGTGPGGTRPSLRDSRLVLRAPALRGRHGARRAADAVRE